MRSTRRRAAAIGTVLALSALGGMALESNHGIPQGTASPAGGHAGAPAIVTSASGGGGAMQSIPVTAARRGAIVPRIVTRASGAPVFVAREEE